LPFSCLWSVFYSKSRLNC